MPDRQYIDIGGFYRSSTVFKQEQPVIWVVLSPFWIDTYPVTNQRYARFIEAGGYKNAGYEIDGTIKPKKYYVVDLRRKIFSSAAAKYWTATYERRDGSA